MVLEETDRLFQCPYCRVRLFITSGEAFRYWLPPPKKPEGEIAFIPYWRFKGMVFFCKHHRTEERIIDTTIVATPLRHVPVSLGVRPQVVPLKYVTGELGHYRFISHNPFDRVFTRIHAGIGEVETLKIKTSSSDDRILYRAFIGETRSLIYLPSYIRNDKLHDALTDTPISDLDSLGSLEFTGFREWGLRFLATLCPHCGWDLTGEKDSLVHFCRNCSSAWIASDSGLKGIEFSIVPAKGDSAIYLPFWKIKAEPYPLQLKSYADLVRFANLPKLVRGEWESKEIAYWVPAFKIQPRQFMKVSRTATLAQIETHKGPLPKERIFTVNLPPHEALESIMINIVNLAVPRRRLLAMINKIKIRLLAVELVLVPFKETPYRYLQQEMHLGFGRELLRYGRNI